jgi:ribosome-associated protein
MEDLTVDEWLVIPANELELTFARSGGPGGQHVNTTDTRVRLRYDVAHSPALPPGVRRRLLEALASRLSNDGMLTITSDRHRSRHRNIEDVRARLKELVLAHRHPPKKRRPTKPSRSSQRRRIEKKKRRGSVKANRRKPTLDS